MCGNQEKSFPRQVTGLSVPDRWRGGDVRCGYLNGILKRRHEG